jgi:hypothetical protein
MEDEFKACFYLCVGAGEGILAYDTNNRSPCILNHTKSTSGCKDFSILVIRETVKE